MDFVLDVNNIECFSKNWGLLLLVNYNISISIQVSSCGWCFGKVEQIELKFLVWHGWYFNSWIKFGCTHFCIDHFLCGHGPNFGWLTKILGPFMFGAWVDGALRWRTNDEITCTYLIH